MPLGGEILADWLFSKVYLNVGWIAEVSNTDSTIQSAQTTTPLSLQYTTLSLILCLFSFVRCVGAHWRRKKPHGSLHESIGDALKNISNERLICMVGYEKPQPRFHKINSKNRTHTTLFYQFTVYSIWINWNGYIGSNIKGLLGKA